MTHTLTNETVEKQLKGELQLDLYFGCKKCQIDKLEVGWARDGSLSMRCSECHTNVLVIPPDVINKIAYLHDLKRATSNCSCCEHDGVK